MGPGFSPLKDKKFLSIIFLFLLFSISIPLITFFFRDQIKQKLFPFNLSSSTAPKIASQGKLTALISEDHPELFYVDLDYNPENDAVIQRNSGLVNGDPSPLFSNPPKEGKPEKFVYKIEVISESKEVTQSGWFYVYKEIAQTESGRLILKVSVKYQPKSLIRVYLPNNKLIWIGRMV